MSHITQATAGLAAVKASKWEDAFRLLSAGIKESSNPAWLIGRSRALVGLKRFEEALDDANMAWHVAYQRNNRDLLAEAQYRRAVAYFRLGQYANADACCIYSMRLIKGMPAVEKQDPAKEHVDADGFWTSTRKDVTTKSREDHVKAQKRGFDDASFKEATTQDKDWRRANAMRVQALAALERLPEKDQAREWTTSLKPEFKKVSQKSTAEDKKPVSAPVAVPEPPSVLRLQDFQSENIMTVLILSKGNNKDTTQVEFLDKSVNISSVKYPNGEVKPYTLRFWGEIDAAGSKYTITPSKIELALKKKAPGRWSQLQGEVKDGEVVADEPVTSRKQEEKKPFETVKEAPKEADKPTVAESKGKEPIYTKAPEHAKPTGPAYPTSSRNGPKNWDSIGDDEDEEEDKDVNFFFQKLFKNADPAQQRAMKKSFLESNGTSLSTDWNDVKDRTVETVPPDGVEAKKWNS